MLPYVLLWSNTAVIHLENDDSWTNPRRHHDCPKGPAKKILNRQRLRANGPEVSPVGLWVVPKAGAVAAAIDCEIIELHSHAAIGVERKVYIPLKPKAGDTTVGPGRTGNLNKLSFGGDSTSSI